MSGGNAVPENAPSVIAWETTRRCHLSCRHCRGAARNEDYAGELTIEEGMRLIDALAEMGGPILILTGGEPMSRPDIYELARHGADSGLRVVMAPCGELLNEDTASCLKAAGVQALSISIDGPDREAHDRFRGMPGAFDSALGGIEHARNAGLRFQVNTTVTKLNAESLPEIYRLALELGAGGFDAFFLVPTGRGAALKELALSPDEQERALTWLADTAVASPIRVKATCAPQYARIIRERGGSATGGHGGHSAQGGCMAGDGFVFISHRGILQPCGFLDVPCGDLRAGDFDFRRLYEESVVFNALRRPDDYAGRCGVCEYRVPCGGCRARAYADCGDILGQEPACSYLPQALRGERACSRQ